MSKRMIGENPSRQVNRRVQQRRVSVVLRREAIVGRCAMETLEHRHLLSTNIPLLNGDFESPVWVQSGSTWVQQTVTPGTEPWNSNALDPRFGPPGYGKTAQGGAGPGENGEGIYSERNDLGVNRYFNYVNGQLPAPANGTNFFCLIPAPGGLYNIWIDQQPNTTVDAGNHYDYNYPPMIAATQAHVGVTYQVTVAFGNPLTNTSNPTFPNIEMDFTLNAGTYYEPSNTNSYNYTTGQTVTRSPSDTGQLYYNGVGTTIASAFTNSLGGITPGTFKDLSLTWTCPPQDDGLPLDIAFVFPGMTKTVAMDNIRLVDISTPPAAVSNVVAAGASSSQVSVNWTDNSSNESGFKIDQSTTSDFSSSVTTATVGPNVNYYLATGLSPATTYYYRVRSTNGAGDSANSATVSALTGVVGTPVPLTVPDGTFASDAPNYYINSNTGTATFTSPMTGTLSGWSLSALPSTANGGGYYGWEPYGSVDAVTTGSTDSPFSNNAPWLTNQPASSYHSFMYYPGELYGYNAVLGGAQPGASLTMTTTGINAPAVTGATYTATIEYGNVSWTNRPNASANVAFNILANGVVVSSGHLTGMGPGGAWTPITVGWVPDAAHSGQAIQLQIVATNFLEGPNPSDQWQVPSFGLANTTMTVAAPPATPMAPSGLTATALSSSQINLVWADNSSNESGFKIDQATSSDFTQNLSTVTVAAGTTAYSAIGLSGGTTYYYRVRATNVYGDSSNTSSATASTPVSSIIAELASGQNLNIYAMGTSLTADGPGTPVYNYGPPYGGSNNAWFDQTTQWLNSLPYTGKVTAFDEAQSGAWSTSIAPYPTGGFNTVSQPSQINWTLNTTAPPDAVFIEFAINDCFTGQVASGVYGTGVTLQQSQANLQTMISQINTWGASHGKNISIFVMTMNNAVNTSGNTVGSDRAQLAAYYQGYHDIAAANPGVTFVDNYTNWLNLYASNPTQWAQDVPDGLHPNGYGSQYVILPQIEKVLGVQSSSGIPSAPSGLTATAASTTQINLSWTDNSSNETGFKIDRATDSAFTQNLTTVTVGANVTTYNSTGLSSSTTYYYRVRATNANGDSANTSTANATTQGTGPTAPSGLTATAASSSQINLAWTDNSSNETGFKVDRATDSGFTQNLTTVTVGANVTTYNSTGLSSATIYYYRVRATNASGDSANTATASATTQGVLPTAPSGLTATAIASSQINLTWTDNSNNETGFKIDQATDSGYTQNLTTVTTAANATTYSATGLSASTTYYYRVRATNSTGDSANTTAASATTPATGTPVSIPVPDGDFTDAANFYINNNTGGGLTFTGPMTATLSGWSISANPTTANGGYYSTGGWEPYGAVEAVTVGSNDSPFTNNAPWLTNQPASSYHSFMYYPGEIYAYGSVVNGPQAGASLTMTTTGINATVVTGTTYNATIQYGNVSWTTRPNNSANIALNILANGVVVGTGTLAGMGPGGAWTPATFSWVADAAHAGQAIQLQVVATNFLEGPAGAQWQVPSFGFAHATLAATAAAGLPTAPSGLSATTASSSQINLSWTDNSNNETGFKIDQATDSGFTQNLTTVTVGANVTTYNATSLSSNTTYYYRVRATNASGDSANTSSANATTQGTIPTAPSALTATTASASQINLSWTDNSNNETGFKIDQATDSGFSAGLTTVTVGANVTTYNVTGLSNNTTYYFRVRATNAVGDSTNTTAANATTLPLAPTAPSGLTATAASSSQINLSWTDNSNNETGFKIDRATDSGFTQNLATVTVGANVTTYNSTGLASNTTYYYRVRATNAAGDSANSTTASATTQITTPTAPSGLSATAISSTQINLSWTDNSGNETGFKIDQATDSGFTQNLTTVTVGANVTTYSATGLTGGITYYYRVRSTNAAGDSANTATASATTPGTVAIPVPDGDFTDSAAFYVNTNTGGGLTFTAPMNATLSGWAISGKPSTANGGGYSGWEPYGVVDAVASGSSASPFNSNVAWIGNQPASKYHAFVYYPGELYNYNNVVGGAQPGTSLTMTTTGISTAAATGATYTASILYGNVSWSNCAVNPSANVALNILANGVVVGTGTLSGLAQTAPWTPVTASWTATGAYSGQAIQIQVVATNFLEGPGSNQQWQVPTFAFTHATLSKVSTASIISIGPAWLGANSAATWNVVTHSLAVTGPTTITADPGTDAPAITADGAAAVVTINTASRAAVHIGSITLTNGASAIVSDTSSPQVLVVATGAGNFNVDSSSTFDLGKNYLDLQNSGGNIAAIETLLQHGFGNGTWNGTGLTSSDANADTSYLTAVGSIINGSQFNSAHKFDGVAPGSNDILIHRTYYGDADLSGAVDGNDYTLLDGGLATPTLKGWQNGDFNYDGSTDGSDYSLIDNDFNQQTTPLAEVATSLTTVALSTTTNGKPSKTVGSAMPPSAPVFASTIGGIVQTVDDDLDSWKPKRSSKAVFLG